MRTAKHNAHSAISTAAALLFAALFLVGFASAQESNVTNAICGIYYDVNTILFTLALTVMVLGGAVYGAANILPGQTRGAVQAYGMGLIIGGIVGAIIGMVAPWVVSAITQTTVTSILSVCPPYVI
jgi:hypothetical protein